MGEAMELLSIYTLGGLRVLRRKKLVTGLETRKIEALLVFLACIRRAIPREVLAELLWDERSQPQAQSNQRVALASLRKNLREYLFIDRETAALDTAAGSGWMQSSWRPG